MKIICVDNDKRVIGYAEKRCRGRGNIRVIECSALDALRDFKADYVISNHFLHHLSDSDIVSVLSLTQQNSLYGYLLNDIRRSRLSMWFFLLFSSVFFHRSFAITDGLISIRKGFTTEQLRSLCLLAGISPRVEDVSPGHLCIYDFKPVKQ